MRQRSHSRQRRRRRRLRSSLKQEALSYSESDDVINTSKKKSMQRVSKQAPNERDPKEENPSQSSLSSRDESNGESCSKSENDVQCPNQFGRPPKNANQISPQKVNKCRRSVDSQDLTVNGNMSRKRRKLNGHEDERGNQRRFADVTSEKRGRGKPARVIQRIEPIAEKKPLAPPKRRGRPPKSKEVKRETEIRSQRQSHLRIDQTTSSVTELNVSPSNNDQEKSIASRTGRPRGGSQQQSDFVGEEGQIRAKRQREEGPHEESPKRFSANLNVQKKNAILEHDHCSGVEAALDVEDSPDPRIRDGIVNCCNERIEEDAKQQDELKRSSRDIENSIRRAKQCEAQISCDEVKPSGADTFVIEAEKSKDLDVESLDGKDVENSSVPNIRNIKELSDDVTSDCFEKPPKSLGNSEDYVNNRNGMNSRTEGTSMSPSLTGAAALVLDSSVNNADASDITNGENEVPGIGAAVIDETLPDEISGNKLIDIKVEGGSDIGETDQEDCEYNEAEGEECEDDLVECDGCGRGFNDSWSGEKYYENKAYCVDCAFVCVCQVLTPYSAAYVCHEKILGPYCRQCWETPKKLGCQCETNGKEDLDFLLLATEVDRRWDKEELGSPMGEAQSDIGHGQEDDKSVSKESIINNDAKCILPKSITGQSNVFITRV